MSQTGKRWTWDTPSATQRRTTPRQRGANAAKRARIAALEQHAQAHAGENITTTGHGTCHWCGFHVGRSGHANCPAPP